MKNLIIVTLLFVVLASCSDRMEGIQKNDDTPSISFLHQGENKHEVLDSVRYYDGAPFYYNLRLQLGDGKNNLWKLNYEVIKGKAEVYYDGGKLTNGHMRVDLKDILLAINPGAKGIVMVDFTLQDRFENKKTARLNLFVFDNLIPVAIVTARKTAINAPLEYILDGSESYDQDRKFGGVVSGYVFEIEGKVIETTSKQINFIFPTSGTYTVKLKVIDNNGDYSKPTEIKVNVN